MRDSTTGAVPRKKWSFHENSNKMSQCRVSIWRPEGATRILTGPRQSQTMCTSSCWSRYADSPLRYHDTSLPIYYIRQLLTHHRLQRLHVSADATGCLVYQQISLHCDVMGDQAFTQPFVLHAAVQLSGEADRQQIQQGCAAAVVHVQDQPAAYVTV